MAEQSDPHLSLPSGAVHPPSPSLSLPVEAPGREPLLEDYLDHLFAPLVGIVPFSHRQELRRETTAHLDALTDSYRNLGCGPKEATAEAIMQFGDPGMIAREWLTEWEISSGEDASRRGLVVALGLFSLVCIPAWLMFLEPFLDGGEMRFNYVSVIAVILVSGFLAAVPGFLTGLISPRKVARNISMAVLILLLFLAVSFAAQLPPSEGFKWSSLASLSPFLFWFPAGSLAGRLGALMRRLYEAKLKRRFVRSYKMIID
jgi:hypothetical protein